MTLTRRTSPAEQPIRQLAHERHEHRRRDEIRLGQVSIEHRHRPRASASRNHQTGRLIVGIAREATSS